MEIVATLEELRDDGVVLSEVGELGPGPTVFCPWESLHRIRERPPWLRPPREESEIDQGEGYVEIRGGQVGEAGPQPPVERRREPSARTLERVVPVAQKQSVADVTVALTSLELYGVRVGLLRWRVSLGGGHCKTSQTSGSEYRSRCSRPGTVPAASCRGRRGEAGPATVSLTARSRSGNYPRPATCGSRSPAWPPTPTGPKEIIWGMAHLCTALGASASPFEATSWGDTVEDYPPQVRRSTPSQFSCASLLTRTGAGGCGEPGAGSPRPGLPRA